MTIRRYAATAAAGSVLALPPRIGPAELSDFGGAFIAIRCPSDLAPLMQQAGGEWEPGSRRWLIQRHRISQVIHELRRATDPLFRHFGMDLDRLPP